MGALLVIATLLSTICFLIYLISIKKFNYWKNKNVPHVKPWPIFGNYANYLLLKEYPGQLLQKLCQKFPGQPYFGAYYGTEPTLIVHSPEIIKDVFTKDYYYFNGREISNYVKCEVMTQNLFFASGDRWKVMRQSLTPLFSSAKMKAMFYLLEKCNHCLEDLLDLETSMSNVIEIRGLSARYTMDCICSCAFGIEANAMGNDKNNVFKVMAGQIFEASNWRGFKMIFRFIWPKIFYGLGFQFFPPTIDAFFSKLLKGVFESRNFEPSPRNDFVDLVLVLKKEQNLIGDSMSNLKSEKGTKVTIPVDDDLLVAQCIMFFAAGFDTSSATISYTLYELAKNQEAQAKAHREVDEFLRRHKNKLNYECVNELPYLDACLYEALRLYPLFGIITREVMEDYEFSTGLRVDKGVRVHVPIYHMHYNPDFFPEPQKYKPERFLAENKQNIKQYTFFPYGEGPRICIGE